MPKEGEKGAFLGTPLKVRTLGPIVEHLGGILGGFGICFTYVLDTLGHHLGTGNPKERQRNTEEKTKK